MSKKLMTATELTAAEQKMGLPAGWLATLVAKYGPYLVQLVVDLLTGQPAPPVPTMQAKGCPTPEECCCCACTAAAEGIVAMHKGCCDGAVTHFLAAALAAQQGCECQKP